jgi:hypothetical protein
MPIRRGDRHEIEILQLPVRSLGFLSLGFLSLRLSSESLSVSRNHLVQRCLRQSQSLARQLNRSRFHQ